MSIEVISVADEVYGPLFHVCDPLIVGRSSLPVGTVDYNRGDPGGMARYLRNLASQEDPSPRIFALGDLLIRNNKQHASA